MSPIQNLRTSVAYVLICSLFVTGLLTVTPRQSHASNNSLMRSSTPGVTLPSEETGPQTKTLDEATRARVSEAYNKLPLSFEENRGQVDKEVKYLARGAGYTLFLTPTEAVLALRQGDGKKTATTTADALTSTITAQPQPTLMSVLRMKLSGANQSPAVSGESEMGVKTNYFKGNDPQKWQTGVARYERVRYALIYPGVDMIYSGQQQRLGYDFEVAPGADARRIALEFTGVEQVEIERETGDLLLKTAGVEGRQHKPVAYQETEGKRREVASRYVVKGKRKVGIEVGEYDPTKRLVISPVLSNFMSSKEKSGPADSNAPVFAQDQKRTNIKIITSYHNDTSPPLRQMKPLSVLPQIKHRANENPSVLTGHKDRPDTVVQSSPAEPNMPGTNLNFDGIPLTGFVPPDPNGEAGQTQYVQIVNRSYQVFDKTTGTSVLGPVSISTIWGEFGGACQNQDAGDPIVLYDQLANRWIITQRARETESGPAIYECIAVSTTSDATGAYHRYGFQLGSDHFDYPKLGVWPDGYYMSTNVFNPVDMTYLGPQPFAFDRAKMLAGETANGFTLPGPLGGNVNPFLPADLDGSTLPPAGAPETFVGFPGGGQYTTYHFHADFETPGNSSWITLASPAAAGFTALCPNTESCVPTANGADLDDLGDRLMHRLAYRNFGTHESVVGNYTVSSGGVAAVRWFELRDVTAGPVTVFQESTYQPDTTWRWMGSAAMDNQGNLAVGFSASSDSIDPQIRYAGRLATDPLNTLGQGEAHLFDGTGSQTGTFRWGDYSAMSVDPVDDCTFWYTNEYYATTSGFDWRTRIGSFKFPQCTSNQQTNNYSTYLGGSANEFGFGIAVDASGIAYVTGQLDSPDFPTVNQYQTYQTHADAFVVKIDTNASGTASLLYSTYLGGDLIDNGLGIAIDSSGHAYVTGFTDSTNFPTLNQFQTDPDGSHTDAFVTKLDTNASGAASLLYSTYLGGNGGDVGQAIAANASGHAYVTGYTESSDFPTLNPYQPDQNIKDGFVTKLDTNASGSASLLYSTYLGGFMDDVGKSIAADQSGIAYVAGVTTSSDFPLLNQYQTFQGDWDTFVMKLDTNASGAASLLYSTYVGGIGGDYAHGIAVDASGIVYVTGITLSPNFPLLNPYQATYQDGAGDVFVTKLNTNVSGTGSLLYSTFLGGNGRELGTSIDIDSSGHAYVTGDTTSTNFPLLDPLQPDQGGNDAFVTKLDTNASGAASLLYSTYLGGNDNDVSHGIVIDASGTIYVAGYTLSTNFPTINQYQTDQVGYDVFVTKLPNTALISGRVTSDGTTGLGGVTITLSGSMSNTAVTDGDGNYSIKVATGGNYTVTPSKDALTFTPPEQSFNNLQANQTGVNFTANQLAISGRVTSDGTTGLSDVTVTLSGSQTGTVITDSTGNYSFDSLPVGGNYTVTPTKSGLVFEPPERSFTNLQANQTDANFTGGLGTISGRVTSDGVNGIGGVNVNLSGSQTGTVVTDNNGNYSFTDLAGGGNYTVTPSKSDLIFAPPERSFTNLQASQTGVNFTTEPATISGRVTTDTGAGLVGVTMTLTNSTLSLSTTTASDGTYSFSNLPIPANYKVKPTLTDYTFSPSDIVLRDVSANQPDVNFIGTTNPTTQPSTISGRVTIDIATGTSLAGVTITLTSGPDFTLTTTTASDGTYSFNSLPTRDTYTLTPSKTNYTFSPTQIVLNNLKTNQANTNFVAKLKTYTIGGVIKLGGVGVSDVTVTLTSTTPAGFAPRTATTDSTGAYSLTNVPAERNYTVTPTKPGHEFTPGSKSLTNLSANEPVVHFIVTIYSITGRITRAGTTTGISGVTVTITSPVPANFPARTVQTGTLGNYIFTKLPAGRDYTIEPSMTGFTFTPTTRSITNLSSNIPAGSSTNFTGTGP